VPGLIQDGVEQHIRPGGDVFRPGDHKMKFVATNFLQIIVPNQAAGIDQ
jgi:hypothetical protein